MSISKYTYTIPSKRLYVTHTPQNNAGQSVSSSSLSLLSELNKWAGLYAEIKSIKNINRQMADKLPAMLNSFKDKLPKGKEIKFNAIFLREGEVNFRFVDLKLLQQRIQTRKGICSLDDTIIEHSTPSIVSSEYYFPLTIIFFTDEQLEFSKKHGNNKNFSIVYTR